MASDNVKTRAESPPPAQGVSPIGGARWTKTKKRAITRRGVVWLGQTCNLRCYFCYFVDRIKDAHHPEHPFMGIDKAKTICRILREFYGCTAVDIQGGEPTIYPDIIELVSYCRAIGLRPTLITNGIALAKPGALEPYREAGIGDFLVSLHGVGEVHDLVVGRKGTYEKIITAIERMRDLAIPFRFNCTMSEPVVPLLPQIAQKAIEYGAYVVNLIAFNPFGDQETGVRTERNVPRYSDLREPVARSIDILDEAGIEVNVRYLPLCMSEKRHRRNFYNYQQLSYDTREWDFQSWLWTMMGSQLRREGGVVPPFRMVPFARVLCRIGGTRLIDHVEKHPVLDGFLFRLQRLLGASLMAVRGKDALYRREAKIRAGADCKYQYHEACKQCSLRLICDGFHGDYAELFGAGEAAPVTDELLVDDPLHYIRDQEKVVEPED